MIKIIKPGQTTFIETCLLCGCEFSYESLDVCLGYVPCPSCGHQIYHKSQAPPFPKALPITWRQNGTGDVPSYLYGPTWTISPYNY